MVEYAGQRSYRRNRQTGTHVLVADGIEGGYDTDGGRWQTICDEHGTICSHQTLGLAMAFAASPLDWCETCMELANR